MRLQAGLRPPLGARCSAGAPGGAGGAGRDWSGGGAALKGSAPSQGGGAEGLRSDLDLLDIAQSYGGTLDSVWDNPGIASDQSGQEMEHRGLIT